MKNMKRTLCLMLVLLSIATMVPLQAYALTPTYTVSNSYKSGPYYAALQSVQLTGNQRADIVATARSQVGYTEGNSSSSLSGTANGNGNYTEYGNWYGLQDMWCAMFVSWCANQSGISTSVIPRTASTVNGLDSFITAGRAYTRSQVANGVYTPQPGDLIYFKGSRNTNKTNHVGIVTGYNNNTVYTIEGNTSSATNSTNGGGVYEHSFSIQDSYIVYICSPSYTNSNTVTITTEAYFPACGSSYTSIVSALNSIGVDSSYNYRKTIAAKNGISNYSGTASQNTQMLNLLKAGKLIKPNGSTTTIVSNVSYFSKCAASHTSIVNALDSIGADSSFNYRKAIAEVNGISNYTGTYAQNVQMLSLLKAGALKKPASSSVSTVSYFPACSSSYTSIVSALNSIGVDSSYAYRKTIAAKNSISNYSGTASQNTQMLNLLKAGKLIKP